MKKIKHIQGSGSFISSFENIMEIGDIWEEKITMKNQKFQTFIKLKKNINNGSTDMWICDIHTKNGKILHTMDTNTIYESKLIYKEFSKLQK